MVVSFVYHTRLNRIQPSKGINRPSERRDMKVMFRHAHSAKLTPFSGGEKGRKQNSNRGKTELEKKKIVQLSGVKVIGSEGRIDKLKQLSSGKNSHCPYTRACYAAV